MGRAQHQFTPCEDCEAQFRAWNAEREASYRQGLGNAVRTVLGVPDGHQINLEFVRDGYALQHLVEHPEYKHVRDAMQWAYSTGPESVKEGAPVDAETRKEIDAIKAENKELRGLLERQGAEVSQSSWNFKLDRGERAIRRLYPDATDDQVRDLFDKHVRTRGIVGDPSGNEDWGATARAFMPEAFGGGMAAPTGASASPADALTRPSGNGQTSREAPQTFEGPRDGELPVDFKTRAREELYARGSAAQGG